MRQVVTVGDVYGPQAGPAFAQQANTASVQVTPGTPRQAGGAVPVTQLLPQLKNSVFGAPLLWLFGFIGVLIAWKLIEEHRGGREAFDEMKIGLNNTWKVGLMALIVFAAVRFLSTRYSVPGVSPFLKYATGG